MEPGPDAGNGGAPDDRRGWLTPARRVRLRRFVRYAVGSALATLASAVAFTAVYRWLGGGPRTASLTAFACGALVNFVSGRFWAWERTRRVGLGRDMASYAVVAVGTALGAAGVTTVTEWYARRAGLDATGRTLLVEGSYFATYAVMFLIKFMLLDRVVFGSRAAAPD